jgi:hypothetical protein
MDRRPAEQLSFATIVGKLIFLLSPHRSLNPTLTSEGGLKLIKNVIIERSLRVLSALEMNQLSAKQVWNKTDNR